MKKKILYFSLGLLFILSNASAQIDSLKRIVYSKKHDTLKIQALFKWDDLIYYSDPELDLKLNIQIKTICQQHLKIKNDKNKFYQLSLAKTENNLGMIYFDRGDYVTAIDYHSKSLKLNEELKDKNGAALTTGNLANIYYQLKEYEKALTYYQKSLIYTQAINNKILNATTLNNIANIYADRFQNEEAIINYRQSLQISYEINDTINIARALNNIGNVYNDIDNLDSALYYFQKSLMLRESVKDLKGIASSKGDMGLVYYKKKQYQIALSYLQPAYDLAEKINSIIDLKNIAFSIYNCHKEMNNYQASLSSYETYTKLKDSVASTENTRALIQREYKYDYDKKTETQRIKTEEQKKITKAKLAENKAKIAQQETQKYALFSVLFLVLGFLMFMFNRFKVVQKQKKIIEQKELETQRQKEIVEEKQREILDSISYAKRIQDAILPTLESFSCNFKDNSILYLPKDIIAGDFYWMEKTETHLFFAVADCTGHGVPGAMVSVVCSTALTKCIAEYHLTSPGEILNRTKELVVKQFEKSNEQVRDGMDISLCALELNSGILKFAGANNSLVLITSNKELKEYTADKQPIGQYELSRPFETQVVNYQIGDMIYLFSDGYADQFGGEFKKKFRKNNLFKLLIEICSNSCMNQMVELNEKHLEWRGSIEQVDDICIMGIRL